MNSSFHPKDGPLSPEMGFHLNSEFIQTPLTHDYSTDTADDSQFQVMDDLLKQIFHAGYTEDIPSNPSHFVLESDKTSTSKKHIDESDFSKSKLKPGDFFGPFLIHNYIGHGGFGVVFRAIDTRYNREVALKIPRIDRPQYVNDFKRYQNECRLISSLNHPSIVSVWNVGRIKNIPYLCSEFHRGETLAAWIHQHSGGLGLKVSVNWIYQLVSALDFLHSNAVVHRDLKPSNVLISETTISHSESATTSSVYAPKLIDFGLGTKIDLCHFESYNATPCVGTPAYMSPESAMCAIMPVDIRSDIYSLGLIFGEMITGRRMSRFLTVSEILAGLCEMAELTYLQEMQFLFPADIFTVLEKCLEPKPERRYQTPGELLHDLEILNRE